MNSLKVRRIDRLLVLLAPGVSVDDRLLLFVLLLLHVRWLAVWPSVVWWTTLCVVLPGWVLTDLFCNVVVREPVVVFTPRVIRGVLHGDLVTLTATGYLTLRLLQKCLLVGRDSLLMVNYGITDYCLFGKTLVLVILLCYIVIWSLQLETTGVRVLVLKNGWLVEVRRDFLWLDRMNSKFLLRFMDALPTHLVTLFYYKEIVKRSY